MKAAQITKIRRQLLAWYATHKRDLPWRKNRDPYRIWLSEIMLQQTRVETVLPYYKKFLEHYPRIEDLAKAEIDELRSLWAGLGYYTRVMNLQRAAQKIVAEFGGKFPHAASDLRRLPGIGPYTSAAIASMAFGENVPAIDGNLERVIARLIALQKPAKGSAEVLAFANALTAEEDAGALNQALMDLSSMICSPRQPKCLACPLANLCEARARGLTEEIPVKLAKREKVDLLARALLLFRKEKAGYEILLARRPQGAWLSGMWDLPWWLPDRDGEPEVRALRKEGHVQVKRTITHHRIRFDVRFGEIIDETEVKKAQRALRTTGSEFQWIPTSPEKIESLPNPSRKAILSALKTLQ